MDKLIDFTRRFHDQYLDGDTFQMTPETEFRQVGSWDSLTGMVVLVMIKDEYGIDISPEEFKKLKTVNDVYSLIKTKKQ